MQYVIQETRDLSVACLSSSLFQEWLMWFGCTLDWIHHLRLLLVFVVGRCVTLPLLSILILVSLFSFLSSFYKLERRWNTLIDVFLLNGEGHSIIFCLSNISWNRLVVVRSSKLVIPHCWRVIRICIEQNIRSICFFPLM